MLDHAPARKAHTNVKGGKIFKGQNRKSKGRRGTRFSLLKSAGILWKTDENNLKSRRAGKSVKLVNKLCRILQRKI